VLDGEFDEWPEPDAMLIATGDREHVYLLLSLDGPPVNLQALSKPGVLMLELDGDATTGSRNLMLPGADLELVFSPEQGRRSGGAQIRLPGRTDGDLNPDVVELVFAPTTASTRFEIRLPRTMSTSAGELRIGSAGRWALTGGLGEASGSFTAPADRPEPRRVMVMLPECPADAARIVSWNVELGGILDNPEPFVRILRALQPHVVLLQELEGDQSADDIAAVLAQGVSGTWQVALGPLGGRLRSAVASRLPAKRVSAIDSLKRRDNEDRSVRAAALSVDIPGLKNVLMTSLHLKCCGGADGPEDMTRIAEVLAVKRAVALAHAEDALGGALLGGDLNLVGSRVPLDLFVFDGESMLGGTGDLVVAHAMRPAGGGLQTWGKSGQRYTPGRLDWILMTGSTLQPVHAFVCATSELPPPVLASAKLRAGDATAASDHLPVVVDVVAVD
jgi:endonuclease/exonuclease/phosphatase family metal-dependent hydrolase